MATENPIKVGGAYQESEDHVPNPTDIVGQFNTSGTGAHGKIEEVSPIFEVDKVKVAQEVLAALDPDNKSVDASRVILPNPVDDNDVARDELRERAEARVAEGVVVGEATPAEREGALEGNEGSLAAVEQERSNAASNSTGNRAAGEHEGTVNAGDAGRDDTSLAGARAAKGGDASGSDEGDKSSDDKSGQTQGQTQGSDEAKTGDKYEGKSSSDLAAEVKSRNEGREEADKVKPKSRSTEDLAAALREDDEKQAKA